MHSYIRHNEVNIMPRTGNVQNWGKKHTPLSIFHVKAKQNQGISSEQNFAEELGAVSTTCCTEESTTGFYIYQQYDSDT